VGLALLFLLLALWPSSLDLFQYQRTGISQGEFWRVFTGHFVHLNFSHALLNSIGLLLLARVMGEEISRRDWWMVTLLAPFVISLGLWLKQPTLIGYAGFSGVLHGLLYFGVLRLLPKTPWLALAVLVLLAGRQVWEQTGFYDPDYLRGLIAGRVMPDAHLFGALTGTLLGLWSLWRDRLRDGTLLGKPESTGYSSGTGPTPDA
jgi:rhomboid family GlyGly-CTERM serine protease